MSNNVSTLPHPPPYYKLCGETALEPPPLPSDGDTIVVFGIEETCPPDTYINNPAYVKGILACDTENDPADLATKLHKTIASAMKGYCQLLAILSQRPGLKPPKEDDIQRLFSTAHLLLNSARDYQYYFSQGCLPASAPYFLPRNLTKRVEVVNTKCGDGSFKAREDILKRLKLQVAQEEELYSSLEQAIRLTREDQTISEKGIISHVPAHE